MSLNLIYQRTILSGFLSENIDEDLKVKEKIRKILQENYSLFTKEQQIILRECLNELDEMREEGCYSCWLLSEALIEKFSKKFPYALDELLEILNITPIVLGEVKKEGNREIIDISIFNFYFNKIKLAAIGDVI